MTATRFATKDFLYIIPASLLSGALFTSIERGEWWLGLLSFSFVFLLFFVLLKMAYHWSTGERTLGYIIALTFLLRLAVGVTLQVALPIYGHEDEDDRA